MSIKSIIRRWLGIEEPKQRVSATRAYQAPVQYAYKETAQRLPFNGNIAQKEARFRKYGKSPSDIRQFYNACGGYPIFSKILKHVDSWYTVNQRTDDTAYPYVLIVFDNDSVSSKGNPESRSFRVKSYEDGHRCALRLLDIHDSQERKRQN